MKIINENTAIPIGLVIVITGGIVWITRLSFVSENNAQALEVVAKKQEVYIEQLSEMKSDIRVIKQILIKEERENGK